MIRCVYTFLALAALTATSLQAQADDYSLKATEEGPPSEELAKDIAALISGNGFSVVRGESRTVCELWFCKQWEVGPELKPPSGLLYPFRQGQLIGVLKFSRRGSDFRDQDIDSGVYTLRYALQPIDGNHVGTSPTRDFLCMVRAEDDKSAKDMEVKELMYSSADAAQSNHPGMLCLQRPPEEAKPMAKLKHDADQDWWLLQFTGTAKSADKTVPLPVSVVVVGHADE